MKQFVLNSETQLYIISVCQKECPPSAFTNISITSNIQIKTFWQLSVHKEIAILWPQNLSFVLPGNFINKSSQNLF